jgi:nicotinate-nucleotide--dimethylbenzimidazole phosphoribosyltransferase
MGSIGIHIINRSFAEKMAGITGRLGGSIGKKTIIVMCGDNGVTEEQVSSFPHAVPDSLILQQVNDIFRDCFRIPERNDNAPVITQEFFSVPWLMK